MNPNTLINGDSLTVLRQMESESIDFIITDPPYGIDYQSNRPRSKKTPKRRNRKSPMTKALLFGGCMTPFAF